MSVSLYRRTAYQLCRSHVPGVFTLDNDPNRGWDGLSVGAKIRPQRSGLSELPRWLRPRRENRWFRYVAGRVHLRLLQGTSNDSLLRFVAAALRIWTVRSINRAFRFTSDRGITTFTNTMDVTRKRDVRTFHTGERRLELRGGSVGSLFFRQAAVLRAQQRRSKWNTGFFVHF